MQRLRMLLVLNALLAPLPGLSATALATEEDASVRDAYVEQSQNFRAGRKVPTDVPADRAYVQILVFDSVCTKEKADLTTTMMLYTTLAQARNAFPGCGIDEFCYSHAFAAKLLPRLKAAGFTPLNYMQPYSASKMVDDVPLNEERTAEVKAKIVREIGHIVFRLASDLNWDRYALEPDFMATPPNAQDNTCGLGRGPTQAIE